MVNKNFSEINFNVTVKTDLYQVFLISRKGIKMPLRDINSQWMMPELLNKIKYRNLFDEKIQIYKKGYYYYHHLISDFFNFLFYNIYYFILYFTVFIISGILKQVLSYHS